MKLSKIFSSYSIGDVCTGAVQSLNGVSASSLLKRGVIKHSSRKTPILSGLQNKGASHTEEYIFMGFDNEPESEDDAEA